MGVKTEADFTQPFQVIQEIGEAAANRLNHKRPPAYKPSEVTIFYDGRTGVSLKTKSPAFDPAPDMPVSKIIVPGWHLKADRFFMSYDGRLMVTWHGDYATYVVVKTYDTIRVFFEPEQLVEAADELLGIVAGTA